MSAHVVLLFGPDRASKQPKRSIAAELEGAGYEVIEATNLQTAAALLFVSRRVEVVVFDAASDQIGAEFASSVRAIRPGVPLVRTSSSNMQAYADEQLCRDQAEVLSTLGGLLNQRDVTDAGDQQF